MINHLTSLTKPDCAYVESHSEKELIGLILSFLFFIGYSSY